MVISYFDIPKRCQDEATWLWKNIYNHFVDVSRFRGLTHAQLTNVLACFGIGLEMRPLGFGISLAQQLGGTPAIYLNYGDAVKV